MRYHQLNREIFIENRSRFTALMKPKSLAIFTSNDIYPTSADGHLPFKQHSDILFLSGADQEESILVLFPDAHKNSLKEVLFFHEHQDIPGYIDPDCLLLIAIRICTGLKEKIHETKKDDPQDCNRNQKFN